jgi:EmrB/QacA subfamily drug resistance transporter
MVVLPGAFLGALNVSLLNVALPTLMEYFKVSAQQIQWLVTTYIIILAVVMPLSGYLAKTRGAKNIYRWSLILFLIGSVLGYFGNSLTLLLLARVIQAVGVGLLVPVSMMIIYHFIPLNQRGLAMGIWGLAAMAAPAIGPVLCGYLLGYYSWSILFLLNIPIILVALGLARLLHETPIDGMENFDLLGFATLTLGVVSFFGGINYLSHNVALSIVSWTVAAIASIYFVFHELKTKTPLLDLKIFAIKTFSIGNIVSASVNIGLFGGVVILPLYTQQVLGYSPLETGLVMGPAALLVAVAQPAGGWLLDRFDSRIPIIGGLVIISLSTWFLSRITVLTSYSYLLLWQMVRGIGLGLSFAVAAASLNAVSQGKIAHGSALINTLRQISGALGTLIIVIFYQWRLTTHAGNFPANKLTLLDAMALASGESFLLICIVTLITLPLAFHLKDPKKDPGFKEPVQDISKQVHIDFEGKIK